MSITPRRFRARLRELDPVMVLAALVLGAIGGGVVLLAVVTVAETTGH